MIALNSSGIFVGQIKQILKEFNLPLCKIGDKNLPLNSYYIKNNAIYYCDAGGNKIRCFDYTYNGSYLNITNNFKIDNMIYDKATHEYLGKYLRFLRDYKNFNLMSMYNCFGGNVLEKDLSFSLNNSFTPHNPNSITYNIGDKVFSVIRDSSYICVQTHISSADTDLNNSSLWVEYDAPIEFNSNDKDYVVYKIPVSLMDTYSISIHNNKNVELCLYDANDSTFQISKQSYKKIQINNIFYYEVSDIDDTLISNDLNILLKVPKDLNTSITVLEGKYYDKYNKLNVLPIGQEVDFKIAAQLLSMENTHSNYVLADRIFEYLTGAVICNLSESYDIKRMQLTLDRLYTKEIPYIPSATTRIYGIWDNHDTEIIKYLAIKYDLIRYDSLGYIDKDIENYLIAKTDFDNVKADWWGQNEEE